MPSNLNLSADDLRKMGITPDEDDKMAERSAQLRVFHQKADALVAEIEKLKDRYEASNTDKMRWLSKNGGKLRFVRNDVWYVDGLSDTFTSVYDAIEAALRNEIGIDRNPYRR